MEDVSMPLPTDVFNFPSSASWRRRALVGGAVCMALSLPMAHAQSSKGPRRIGLLWLGSGDPLSEAPLAFFGELARQGWRRGENLVVDDRVATDPRQSPELAAELVALRPDALVSLSGTAGTLALKEATSEIPIVMVLVSDPAGKGLVASLSHPGGNITGNAFFSRELDLKRFELLTEVIGNDALVAVLDLVTEDPWKERFRNLTPPQPGGRPREIAFIEIRSPDDFEPAFERIVRERMQAVAINQFPLAAMNEARVAAHVTQHRLPAVADGRGFAEGGGLMSYTTDLADLGRHAANFVARIFEGARPSDLPIELASRFSMTINLKTASALGLKMPAPLLASADHFIE
jgi:putative ABC transport system substrate-binding protein